MQLRLGDSAAGMIINSTSSDDPKFQCLAVIHTHTHGQPSKQVNLRTSRSIFIRELHTPDITWSVQRPHLRLQLTRNDIRIYQKKKTM